MATAQKLVELAPTPERKPKKLLPPVWEGVEYPRHPPGIYDVRCNLIQGPEWLKNHRRFSIRLQLSHGRGQRERIPQPGGRSEGMRRSKAIDLLQTLVQSEWRSSAKGQVMDWNVFIGKFFRVRVEDATKNGKGEPLSEAERYSKIVEFLEFLGP